MSEDNRTPNVDGHVREFYFQLLVFGQFLLHIQKEEALAEDEAHIVSFLNEHHMGVGVQD